MKAILQRFLNLLKNLHFADIFRLSAYAMGGQVLSLIVQPIASRIYTPAELGVLSLLTSLVAMFVPLYTMQYDYCIISSKDEREAFAYMKLSLMVNAVSAGLLGVGVIVYNILFPEHFAELGAWIYTVPVAMFVSGYTATATSCNTRDGEYKTIGLAGFIRSVAQNASKLGFGFLKFSTTGLIISYFIGLVSGLRMQSRQLMKNIKAVLAVPMSEVKAAAIRQIRQPVFSTPGVFFITASNSLVLFGLKQLYGIDVAGQYSMAMTLMALPIGLVSNNIGKVFFRNASIEYNQTGSFLSSLKKNLIMLAVLGIIPFGVLAIWGEGLMVFFLGAQWDVAGQMIQLMAFWYYFYFVVGAVMSGFLLSGKQLVKMILQFLFIVWAGVAIGVSGAQQMDCYQYVQMISLGFGVIYIIMAAAMLIFGRGKRK